MRPVQKTIFAVEKQQVLHICVCVCVCARALVRVWAWVGVSARALACASARVALLIQHAMRHHILICGLSGSTTFFDITS